MSQNSFEHTTSIVGLTCKPLDILSKTISPQEMSRVQGGFDPNEEEPGLEEPPYLDPPSGTECPPGCIEYCCDGPINITIDLGGPQTLLPPLGTPRPPTGAFFSFSGPDDSNSTAPDSVDTSALADSSGTQDQNGGALDSEEEDYYDWIDPDDEEDWEYFIDEWEADEGSSGYEGVDTPEQIFQP